MHPKVQSHIFTYEKAWNRLRLNKQYEHAWAGPINMICIAFIIFLFILFYLYISDNFFFMDFSTWHRWMLSTLSMWKCRDVWRYKTWLYLSMSSICVGQEMWRWAPPPAPPLPHPPPLPLPSHPNPHLLPTPSSYNAVLIKKDFIKQKWHYPAGKPFHGFKFN